MKKFTILLLFIFTMQSSWPAKLLFKDGTTLEGKIKRITEDKIILEYDFGEVERLRADIQTITNLMPSEENLMGEAPMPAAPADNKEAHKTAPSQIKEEPSKEAAQKEEPALSSQNQESSTPSPTPQATVPNTAALPDIVNESDEDKTEENSADTDLEKSAYNSILMLKEKIRQNYEKQKNEMNSGFEKERLILEKNLDSLAKKYTSLKDKDNASASQISELKLKLEQQNDTLEKYSNEVLNLKKQINELNQQKLKADLDASENIKNTLTKNKELLEKEKHSLIESYESQIGELKKQLDQTNFKVMELAKENSDLADKLANAEKMSDQTAQALKAREREIESYKKEFGATVEKNNSEKGDIEKTLSSSAETIATLKKQVKKLKNENANLKDANSSLKTDMQSMKSEMETLDKEREKYKNDLVGVLSKEKSLKEKNKKEHAKLLKSLVNNALEESKKGSETASPSAAPEAASPSDKENALPDETRVELYGLYQNEIKKLSSKLSSANNELKQAKDERDGLKNENAQISEQMKGILEDQKSYEERMKKSEDEKKELKAEIGKLINQMQEENRKSLEKQKEEIRQEIRDSLKSLEAKKTQVKEEIKPKTEETQNEEAIESPSGEEIEEVEAQNPEKQVEKNKKTSLKTEKTQNTEKKEEEAPSPAAAQAPTIEVGTVSQIEPEFSRVFIDTKEILKEGEKIFVSTEKGEAPFTIIKVYQTMNGAIAEIKEPDLIKFIKLKDIAYVK